MSVLLPYLDLVAFDKAIFQFASISIKQWFKKKKSPPLTVPGSILQNSGSNRLIILPVTNDEYIFIAAVKKE